MQVGIRQLTRANRGRDGGKVSPTVLEVLGDIDAMAQATACAAIRLLILRPSLGSWLQFGGGHQHRLGPRGDVIEGCGGHDLTIPNLEQESGRGGVPSFRRRLVRVVEEAQVSEHGQGPDEVRSTRGPALPDAILRDVMSAMGDALPDATDVKLGRFQADVDHADAHLATRGAQKQLDDGLAAERGLEGEVSRLVDCAGKVAATAVPSPGLRSRLRQASRLVRLGDRRSP
jgi:hypothetical protein